MNDQPAVAPDAAVVPAPRTAPTTTAPTTTAPTTTAPTTTTRTGATAGRTSRHHAPVTVAVAPVPRWPARPRGRWVARLVLSLPFVVLAVVIHAVGQVSHGTRELVAVADVAFAAEGPFGGMQAGHPPLALLVAALPAGALVVDLVVALAAGLACHAVAERLLRGRTPGWLTAVVLVTVMVLVGLRLALTSDPTGIVALCLLAVALDGVTRFAAADTHGGFVAGLLVAAAVLTAPHVLPFALALGLVPPLVARHRYRDQRRAGSATAAVLLFPTVASLLAWTFLEWRFTGGVEVLGGLLVAPDHGSPAAAAALVGTVLLLSPLYLTAGAVLALRRPYALLALGLVPVGLGLTALLAEPWSVGRGVMLTSLVAAMALPSRPRLHHTVVVGAACAAQVAAVAMVL